MVFGPTFSGHSLKLIWVGTLQFLCIMVCFELQHQNVSVQNLCCFDASVNLRTLIPEEIQTHM